MPGLTFNQGDIILINFPFSNYADGKVRPAVVISNELANKVDVVCAQITSVPHHDDLSFVLKDSDVTDSLRGYSEIRCHKIFTADKGIIKKKISRLHSSSRSILSKKIISLFEAK